jgi:hypothetical protein
LNWYASVGTDGGLREARPLNWYRRRALRGKAVELVLTEGFERQEGVELVPTEGFERQGFVFVELVHRLVPTRGFDEMVPTKK